jgi:hypothetical protein
VAAVGGEGQVIDHIRQAADALHHAAAGAIEQVEVAIGAFGAGPAPQGHPLAVGAEGHGEEPALLVRAYRHPQHRQLLAAGQVPHPGGLVVGSGDGVTDGRIHPDAPDQGGVHAGLDGREGLAAGGR